MIFQTKRLKVRKAETSDVDFYLSLWNSGKVMQNVGFPNGLRISRERVKKQIKGYGESEFHRTLVVVEKKSGKTIGECKLGFPSEEGISITDIKLLLEFWGNGYGKEIKNALCLYLFSRTNCKIKVILSLPGWFGLEEANNEYIEKSANTNFYAAYMFNKVVGFFSIISHFPQTSEIYVCGILSEYHRLGLGSKLLKVIEKDLKKKGVNFLTVKTLSASHPDKGYAKTRKFYESVGFVPLEEFKELWGKENPCLFMVKEL